MINKLSSYILKTQELEEEIEELKQNNFEQSATNCICINQNFPNLEVIFPKKIFISQIDIGANSNLYFQGQVEILSNVETNLCVSFLVNNSTIQKIEKKVFAGNNIFSIYCNFLPISSEKLDIYVKIEQKDNIAVYLQNVSFFAWGTFKNIEEPEYQVLDLGDNYLVSLLFNHQIYSKTILKQSTELAFDDLGLVDFAISYSYSFLEQDKKLYLFRVDQNKNLFGSDLTANEFLIEKNVSYVTSVAIQNEIHIFFIQDKKCYEIIIDNNQNISGKKLIDVAGLKFEKVSCYLSSVENKLYLILSDKYDSNYLLTQCEEAKQCTESIKATYDILIETQGGL